jgi:hypothetical protein
VRPAAQTKPPPSRPRFRLIAVVNPGHTRAATPGPSASPRSHSASSSGAQPAAAAFHRAADRGAEDVLRCGRPGELRPPKPNAPRRALRSNPPCTKIIAALRANTIAGCKVFSQSPFRFSRPSTSSRYQGCVLVLERTELFARRTKNLVAIVFETYIIKRPK